jgi:2-polyprenyl-3-methyl-5-hydroxy-6-metoxy-1,4-benzoquinol methylase
MTTETTLDSLPLPALEIVNRDQWVTDYCTGKDVLHLGCADSDYTDTRLDNLSAFMHYRLSRVCWHLVGLDISQEDLAKLKSRWPEWELVTGNVEHLDQAGLGGRFDLILAGEIIEHLLNPGLFLSSARGLLKPDTGRMVITTPNHFGTRRLVHMLRGREKNHPHHTCYYSYHTLQTTLKQCGYRIDTTLGYSSPPSGGPAKRALYFLVERLPEKFFTSHACDGLIFVAHPD